jgi:hypothetical protein
MRLETLRGVVRQAAAVSTPNDAIQAVYGLMKSLTAAGKLTDPGRTPDRAALKGVLDSVLEAAKVWEAKARKEVVEDLRRWLGIARQHANRLDAAGAAGVGAARAVRDMLDDYRAALLKLPSIRVRAPRPKAVKPPEFIEHGIARMIAMLKKYPDLLEATRRGSNSAAVKKLYAWVKDAAPIWDDTKKAVNALPEGKEKARAETILKQVRHNPAQAGLTDPGWDGLFYGDTKSAMEYGKPEVLRKQLHIVVALWEELDQLIKGQQMLFAAGLGRRPQSMDLATLRARLAGRSFTLPNLPSWKQTRPGFWSAQAVKHDGHYTIVKISSGFGAEFYANNGRVDTLGAGFENLKAAKNACLRHDRGEEAGAAPLAELEDVLKKYGYDPRDAKKFQDEDMGALELEERAKIPGSGVGTLEYSHGLKRVSAGLRRASIVKPLYGHDSPANAYVVDDYPYGFRLRTKIRYWLEFKTGKGFRFVSQTMNPKIVDREVWNKPKASTYTDWAGAMYLDEKGHVAWTGLGRYSDVKEFADFVQHFPQADLALLKKVVPAKIKYLDDMMTGRRVFTVNGVPHPPSESQIGEYRKERETWVDIAERLHVPVPRAPESLPVEPAIASASASARRRPSMDLGTMKRRLATKEAPEPEPEQPVTARVSDLVRWAKPKQLAWRMNYSGKPIGDPIPFTILSDITFALRGERDGDISIVERLGGGRHHIDNRSRKMLLLPGDTNYPKGRNASTRRAESEEVTGYDVEFSKNDSFAHIRKFKLDSQGKATITIPATLTAQGQYGGLFDVPDTKTTGKLVLQVDHGDWDPEYANAEATIASLTQKGGPVKVGGTTCNVDGELEVYGHGSSGPLRAPPALLFKGTFTFKAP